MQQELQRTLVLPTTDYNGRISEVQPSIAEITARLMENCETTVLNLAYNPFNLCYKPINLYATGLSS
ncbi:hypothetical protein QYM36_019697 [Artemia franciscana]|uniref:Uncharacterized protein n=1 Tax=Artemia franciscana TaxID=6661 RepID=A0AA88HA58_ARTSF|nr:hypothetical protein QYM36_019697 [Artemia franciscana]